MARFIISRLWTLFLAMVSLLVLFILQYPVANLCTNLLMMTFGITSSNGQLLLDTAISFTFACALYFFILSVHKGHPRGIVLFCALSITLFWGIESGFFIDGLSPLYPAWYEINMGINDLLAAAFCLVLFARVTNKPPVPEITADAHEEAEPPGRHARLNRPKWVWLIFILYLTATLWSVFSYALLYSGAVPTLKARHDLFVTHAPMFVFFSLVTRILFTAAAVALFSMKRLSFYLFSWALILSMGAMVYHVLFNHLTALMALPVLVATFIGWCIAGTVLLYCFSLKARGRLS